MTTPYYQDEFVTLYCGDCREVLPSLELRVDAVVTDPPFFMPATHYQSRVKHQRAWADTSILAAFWAAVLDGCVARMRATGHLLAFCNSDSYPVFYPDTYRRFDYVKCLVWDKGRVGLGRVWRNQHELIIAARWDTSVFNDDGKLRADVFRFDATPSADREHPVEKPTSMLGWLMTPVLPPGGCVLDPFAGSGTTLQAAKDLGFRAIGIEAEERYCEIIARRVSQSVLDFGGAA